MGGTEREEGEKSERSRINSGMWGISINERETDEKSETSWKIRSRIPFEGRKSMRKKC